MIRLALTGDADDIAAFTDPTAPGPDRGFAAEAEALAAFGLKEVP
jgi:hypothetical protein